MHIKELYIKGKERSGAASTDGAQAELVAALWLERQGVRIVGRNYRCRLGEIDLIGLDSDVLAFIEVRLRGARSLGSAAESVTVAKQRRVSRAAAHFIATHAHWRDHACRFDVVTADQVAGEIRWQWLQQAFDAIP